MKKFLYVVLSIIVLFFIVAAIAPKDYEVIRTVEINQPSDVVYNYIKYLNNQDNFSTWSNMDPHMKKTFSGEDGTVGYVSRWESDNEDVGVGEQEIIKIEDGKRIDYELRFEQPWESTSPAWLAVSTANSGLTEVEWGFSGHMDYPMNIMLLFMDMDEILGKDLQAGLLNLKAILESN